jgi:hypothetical protein
MAAPYETPTEKDVNSINGEALAQEAKERIKFIEEHGFEPLNDVLSFHVSDTGDVAYIHLGPSKTVPKDELTLFVGGGLVELARRLRDVDRPDLKDVTSVGAISWIVTKRPEWLEFLGFTVDGPIPQKLQDELFPNAKIPISSAHIDKENLLRIYGV